MTWDWEGQKDRIQELYLNQNKPLSDVIAILKREHGFAAKKRAYEKRLKEWKFYKRTYHNTQASHQEQVPNKHTTRLGFGDQFPVLPPNSSDSEIQTEFLSSTYANEASQVLARPICDIGLELGAPEFLEAVDDVLLTADGNSHPLHHDSGDLEVGTSVSSRAEGHLIELATRIFHIECPIQESLLPGYGLIRDLIVELKSQRPAIEMAIAYITIHEISIPEYIVLHRGCWREYMQKLGSSFNAQNYTELIATEISLQSLSDEHHRFLVFCSFLNGSKILLELLSRFLNYPQRSIDKCVLKLLRYKIIAQGDCPTVISIHPHLQKWFQKRLPSDEDFLIAQREVIMKMSSSIFLNCMSKKEDWDFAKLAAPQLEAIIALILKNDSDSFWDEDLLKEAASIADVARRLGVNDKVILILRHVHRLMEQRLGEQHPQTLDTLNSLSVTYISTKNWIYAEDLLRKLVSSRQRSIDRNEFCYLTELSNLIRVLIKQGHVEEARELLTTVSDTIKRIDPRNQIEKARVEIKLGEGFRLCGYLAEAEGHFSRLHKETRVILGNRNPSTLRVLEFLCNVHFDQKSWSHAERLGLELVELSKNVLGEEQVDTLRRVEFLKKVYRGRGEERNQV